MESTPSRGGLNRVHLQCRNLQEFLGSLSPGVLDRLYGHPATCLAVFRELPSLAKNWVMRMLFLEQPLPQAAVALWVKKEFSKAQEQSTGLLSGLRIWHTQLLPGGLQGLILNPVFRQNLRVALLGGGRPGLMTQVSWDPTSMPGMSPPSTSTQRSDGRWSCTSWWAPRVRPSARTWPSSSVRLGS